MHDSRYGVDSAVAVMAPDAVKNRWRELTGITVGQFLVLGLQLGLLALVIRQFHLESRAFYQISVLAFAGFLVHAVLPLRYRLPFFLGLSLAGIALVFGLTSGATLVAIGLGLIGICHLPVAIWIRVVLLLAAGAVLASLRVNLIPAPWSAAIWPILGSMFMFRLIVYLYDLRHEPVRPTLARTLSYFFLLPNVCFPLFPVVDYKTFRRTYYDGEPWRIYQTGVDWIWRGLIQLLIYRFVYQYLATSPSEVRTAADLFNYLVSNFLLYLRVSGQFHVIVGMLHLFGFNLPETHHLYYLASSFNDFWRRINIYWKDFMMKLFYYPAFFMLRHRGQTFAMVVSTLFVFASTWLLHSYQWFWLRGSFPITWQDGLFWGVLAALVVVNALREANRGRKRTLTAPKWTFANAAALSLRTAATFMAICILWSLWTSESLGEWAALWSMSSRQWLIAAAGFAGFLLLATLVGPWIVPGSPLKRTWSASRPALLVRSPLAASAAILLVYVLGLPGVYNRIGWPTSSVVEAMRRDKLNARDDAILERGYYENLLNVERVNSQLWEVFADRPADEVTLHGTDLVVWTPDFLRTQLRPSAEILHKGNVVRTNQWGMRDQEYAKEHPPATYRIALLGSSHVMGSGVSNDAIFETLLEKRLNEDAPVGSFEKYEILNFAVGGYGPLQQMVTFEQKALGFQPDALFYIAHARDSKRAQGHLVERFKNGIEPPYEYLRSLMGRAGVDDNTPQFLVGRKLEPFSNEIVSWVYQRTVELCKERSILPVWIYLPMVHEEEDFAEVARSAREAGFITLDLSRVYDGHNARSLQVSKSDTHPNVRGHQLIAERFYEHLMADDRLRLALFPTTAQTTGPNRSAQRLLSETDNR